MLSEKEIDENYNAPDPWSYQTCPADLDRKARILYACSVGAPYQRALDIGCGEGWITKDLPAKKIFGHELSAQARERWPENVKLFTTIGADRRFDLVVMTGVLYLDYDWTAMLALAFDVATRIVVTSHIADREVPQLEEMFKHNSFEQIVTNKFPYPRPESDYVQRLRVFRKK